MKVISHELPMSYPNSNLAQCKTYYKHAHYTESIVYVGAVKFSTAR